MTFREIQLNTSVQFFGDYSVYEILAAFPKTQSGRVMIGGAVDQDLPPIEALTPRELEVLRLIVAEIPIKPSRTNLSSR